MRFDVMVLGAGIVGVSVALHLQGRGRSVVLVDRRDPGEETSFGNAGLIESSSIVPYAFPRNPRRLLSYAFGRSAGVYFQFGQLVRMAPWLARYWWHSAPARLARAADDMLPLIERAAAEHLLLAEAAGSTELFHATGWIEGTRDPRTADHMARDAQALDRYGVRYEILDGMALKAREPALQGAFAGAVHWLQPLTVRDPGAVVKSYAALFERRGGLFLKGDGRTAQQIAAGWGIEIGGRTVAAGEAVVALGPWSNDVCGKLGYRLPLGIKRGYHRHYAAGLDGGLNRPFLDLDGEYLLAPMNRGIRLTTGVELAPRDAAPSPIQIARAEPLARATVRLGAALDATPWVGSRPCFADMRPVIGPAPRHRGLWFAFGHNHHGLTLGPVTGRLLAEMMTGEAPSANPAPYRPDRF